MSLFPRLTLYELIEAFFFSKNYPCVPDAYETRIVWKCNYDNENITQFRLVMKFDPADSFYERHLFWFRTGVSLFRFMLFLMEICDYYNGLMPKHYWITELCSIESEWHLISMYVKLPAQRSIISRKKCFVSPQVVISTSQLELLLGCDYLHYAQKRNVGGRINTLTNPR